MPAHAGIGMKDWAATTTYLLAGKKAGCSRARVELRPGAGPETKADLQ